MNITGGCYCGGIRYEVDGEPEAAVQCHCRECQYITGGLPNVVMVFAKGDFNYTKGIPSKFARSDLDNPVTRHFCQMCGTPIATEGPSRPDSIILKVGTMDDPSVFSPKLAMFTSDKQDFHHIPDGIPQFEKRPQKKD